MFVATLATASEIVSPSAATSLPGRVLLPWVPPVRSTSSRVTRYRLEVPLSMAMPATNWRPSTSR